MSEQTLLLPKSVQQFIRDHAYDDERDLVLRNASIENVPISIIAQQIAGRRKAKEKLPTYYNADGIYYPPAINVEQSSSEITAKLKCEILAENCPTTSLGGADLSGGFGVDSFFMGRAFSAMSVTEPNESLLAVIRHNHQALGVSNIHYFPLTAEAFLNSTASAFDFMYVDPSRRLEGDRKIFRLSESVPDAVNLRDAIFEKTAHLLVKTSPLMDLQLGVKELRGVKKIYVISVKNECKEVLFLCGPTSENEAMIEAIEIKGDGTKERIIFTATDERASSGALGDPLEYIYEPNAAILKAGAFKLIGNRFNLAKVDINTHLYTSDQLIEDFPGRIFRRLGEVKADPKTIRQHFPEGKANIITRNYPLSPDELKKKVKLKDGGDNYLIGFSGKKKKFLFAVARIK